MHAFIRLFLLNTIAILVAACSGGGTGGSGSTSAATTPVTATTTTDANATVTFIHFNDLHAHLVPHYDLVPNAPVGQTATTTKVVIRGGLARTATLIKSIRAQAQYSVLMNIGDTYHGGVEALYTLGNAVVPAMNALGVDVAVPGNWDYAYGPVVTRKRFAIKTEMWQAPAAWDPTVTIERPNFPHLGANVFYAAPSPLAGQAFLPATMIKTFGNVKVGFIGLTSDIVAQMYAPLAMGLSFTQGETAYRDLVNQHAANLRAQGAHIVVVMSELGLQKNYRLANILAPGAVDVIFSAHTHEAVFTPLASSSGAYVVEAGNDGYVGRMDITVTNGSVSARHWQLTPVTPDIAEDTTIANLIAQARAPFITAPVNLHVPLPGVDQQLNEPITDIVGHTPIPIDRRNALSSTFNRFFSETLRQATGTRVALTPGFRFDSVIPDATSLMEDNTVASGNLTVEDVYRLFPVAYTLATAQTSGANLRVIMEDELTATFSTDAFKQGGGWVNGFSGMKAQINLAGSDGARIQQLSYADTGAPILDGDTVSVAGCVRPQDPTDVLCAHGGFQNVTPFTNSATGSAWTVADFVTQAFRNGAVPTGAPANVSDANKTVLWPQAPFVQPLTGVGP